MQNTSTIGFIGAGNMAYALASGLVNNGFTAKNIKLSDTDEALLAKRADEFGFEVFTDNVQLASQSEIIIIAVKPQILSKVCQQLQTHISHNPLIISVVAGVKTNDINRWLGAQHAIVRAMPNTPALFNQGATGLFANAHVSAEQKTLVDTILACVGINAWLNNEDLIDAVTAVSGSGPAYFFLLLELMNKVAVDLGLDEQTAEKLSIQTALGAAVMADKSSDSAKTLRTKISSPNGTTQAAISSFQDANLESIISHAMHAAFDRSKQIGIEMGDQADIEASNND